MRSLLKFALACAGMLMLRNGVGQANANDIYNSSSGLANPSETITFDEIKLSPDTFLSNQYSSLGITFPTNVYYDGLSGAAANPSSNIKGNYVSNYTWDNVVWNPTTISFTSTQSAAAFNFTTVNDQSTEFTALLRGTVVHSFGARTNSFSSNNYYGFSGIAFDQILISNLDQTPFSFTMDNLQLSVAPVPEPSTFALLGLGAIGLAIGAYRRRRNDGRLTQAVD